MSISSVEIVYENRGLQLHLLSALGEIWRSSSQSQEDGTLKKEFVGLSVVMRAKGRGEEQNTKDVAARRMLEDSSKCSLDTQQLWSCAL